MAQTSWHKYELFFTPQAVLDHINGPESFSRQDIRNALKTTYPDTTALAGKDLLYCVDHSLVDPTIYGETIRVCVAVLNEIRATIHEFLLESGAKSVIRLKQSPQATWNFPKDTRKVRGWAQRVDNPEELVKPHFGVSNMVPRIWSFRNPNIAKEQIYALANPGTHVSVTKYRPDLAPITYYMHVPIKLMITVYLSAMQSNYAMHKRKWVHNDIKPANI